MSELPVGWATAPLGEVVEILDSIRVPINAKEREHRLGDVPYFGATGQVGWIDEFLFDQEIVLLGEDGAPFLDMSKPKAYLVNGKSWVNNHAHVLIGKPGLSNRFLMYQLNTIDYREFVSGTTRLKLPQGPMRQISLSVAPAKEQNRIVDEIEKQFTRLDAATAALKRVQANLKRYRASVLKAACEGRLVPTEAEIARNEGRDYEPADKLLQRILRERRARWEADTLAKMQASGKPPKDNHWKQKYKEPSAPDTSNLPPLPEGWCWANLDQLIVSGPQNGLYKAASAYGTGNPIVRIDDYQNDWHRAVSDLRVLQMQDEELMLYRLDARDVIINRVNSLTHLGKCISVPNEWEGAVFESNMMRMQVAEPVSVQWLMDYLHSNEGRTELTSNAKWAVNQASINQEDVKATVVPLPPQEEQTRIAESVSKALSGSSRTLEAAATQLIRSSRLRQTILKVAFTGQLVPQDPTDEPASALLERIRAERAKASGNKAVRNQKARSTARLRRSK
jgi:type I restriction enzyme S subunit